MFSRTQLLVESLPAFFFFALALFIIVSDHFDLVNTFKLNHKSIVLFFVFVSRQIFLVLKFCNYCLHLIRGCRLDDLAGALHLLVVLDSSMSFLSLSQDAQHSILPLFLQYRILLCFLIKKKNLIPFSCNKRSQRCPGRRLLLGTKSLALFLKWRIISIDFEVAS